MKYLLLAILSGALYAQDPPDSLLELAVVGQIISAFKQAGTLFSDIDAEHMRARRFWKNIFKVSVQYGLNKDPVPDPAVYYALPDNTFESDFLAVLKKLKYHPPDKAEAAAIAVMVVQEANDHALVPTTKAELEMIPIKIRKKYDIELPDVDGSPQKGYEAEVFLYQTFQHHSFSQLGRPEVVKVYEFTIKNGNYTCQVKEWVLQP